MKSRVTKLETEPEQEALFRNEARCPFCGHLNYRIENEYTVAAQDTCEHFDGGVVGRLHFYQTED